MGFAILQRHLILELKFEQGPEQAGELKGICVFH